jgi:hypothetical protein
MTKITAMFPEPNIVNELELEVDDWRSGRVGFTELSLEAQEHVIHSHMETTPPSGTFNINSRPTINDRPNRFEPHANSPFAFASPRPTFDFGGLDAGEGLEGIEDRHDPVDRPSHYTAGSIECIDAIEAAISELSGTEAFLVGQILKYCWRHNLKGKPVEDLQKAKWYLDRLIVRYQEKL